MEFIAKNLLRVAGFLVAAQVFLTFGLTSESIVDKLTSAVMFAVLVVPVIAAAAFLNTENGLRAVGYTILLWAGAGTAMFFGAAFGEPQANQFAAEYIPSTYDINLGFGFANLALVLLIGLLLWLRGLKADMVPSNYYGL